VGESMHWGGGGNTVKTLTFEKGGVHAPPSSYSGAAPVYTGLHILLLGIIIVQYFLKQDYHHKAAAVPSK